MYHRLLLLLLAVSLSITAIDAQTTYTATLAGSLESPPNNSPGGGLAQVTINVAAQTMRVHIVAFVQLTGTTVACHIHAATATPGTGTAGVAAPTPGFPTGVTSGTYDQTFDMTLASSYNAAYVTANGGSTATAFAALSSAIATGRAYVNIHTSTFGGGEIRGFLQGCTPTFSTIDTAICSNTFPFTWNGVVFTGPGTKPKVFPNGNSQGCDSTVVMNVTQKDTSASFDTVAICNKYTWHDSTYKLSGDYTFDTTNAAGCDSTAHLNLTILSVTSTTSKTDAACFGSATGSLTVTPTYGVSPFTYRIGTTGSFVSSGTFNGLKAGKYRVTIYDANGCAGVSDQITIAQQAAITGTAAVTGVSCNGTATGSITVTPTTGTGPYTYRLGTSGAYSSPNTFPNLRAASYRIYIKDANGCTGNISATVAQPTKVVISNTKTDLTCFGKNNGTIVLGASGGTSPYTYRLGTVGGYSSTNSFDSLKPGNYRAYVQDANGCLGASVSINIAQSLDPCNPDGKTAISKAAIVNADRKSELSLSPNPANNQFRLMLPVSDKAATVRVFDINGKTLYTTKTASQSITFGQNFAPGIYMVEVRQGENVKTLKAVKN